MTKTDAQRRALADDMEKFLKEIPSSVAELKSNVINPEFLYHFEAHRMQIISGILGRHGIKNEDAFNVLDFGYLHGVFQEFLHRMFPKAHFTVLDRPSSFIFANKEYLNLIKSRTYLSLEPCDIAEFKPDGRKFDVIIVGEVIEHLNPTTVLELLQRLLPCVRPGGLLCVTTPNLGLYNCYQILRNRDRVMDPPVPHPIVGLGHIHLWTAPILSRTAEYAGWKENEVCYYDGREGEFFSRIPKINLFSQPILRLIRAAANRHPSLRGFFVATYVPEKQ